VNVVAKGGVGLFIWYVAPEHLYEFINIDPTLSIDYVQKNSDYLVLAVVLTNDYPFPTCDLSFLPRVEMRSIEFPGLMKKPPRCAVFLILSNYIKALMRNMSQLRRAGKLIFDRSDNKEQKVPENKKTFIFPKALLMVGGTGLEPVTPCL